MRQFSVSAHLLYLLRDGGSQERTEQKVGVGGALKREIISQKDCVDNKKLCSHSLLEMVDVLFCFCFVFSVKSIINLIIFKCRG